MISQALANASASGAAQPGGGLMGMLFPLLVVFGIFYFLILRPQRKREVNHQKYLSALKKGDEVVTQSGIYGRIANVSDHEITLDVGNQIKIRMAKMSVAGPQPVANQKPSS